MDNVVRDLMNLQNLQYKEFHQKLIPTVEHKRIIGIPVPLLRVYAKNMGEYRSRFLRQLPHTYYEENMLHGLILSMEKDMDVCLEAVNQFLPFVDNWAVCDSMRPKCFAPNKPRLLLEIQKWISSEQTYILRFAIEMLMVHFLGRDFKEEYLAWVAAVTHDDYYVNMMIAWYFATALAKQWESALPFIREGKLSSWIHNKTIQKAVESYRITKEQKMELKRYKR